MGVFSYGYKYQDLELFPKNNEEKMQIKKAQMDTLLLRNIS